MSDPRGEVVTTGYPLTQLVACKECGVLLWNIDAHYKSNVHNKSDQVDVSEVIDS